MSDERYYSKRRAGISDVRRDGSVTSAENDRQSGEAERWACEAFGQTYNDEIYETHGDGGVDFYLGGYAVDAKWLGFGNDDGHLIVNPEDFEKERADWYVAVAGSIQRGFYLPRRCWAMRDEMQAKHDMGYGEKYVRAVRYLRRREEILRFVGAPRSLRRPIL